MTSFKVILAVVAYFLIGLGALHFLPVSWRSDLERNMDLLQRFAATGVVLFGLFRLTVDRLKGAPITELLTWFFVIFAGAVLVKQSWVLVGFMALIFVVFLLIDFEKPKEKSVESASPQSDAPAAKPQEVSSDV